MTDRNKFEEMLELLVNEDRDAAETLFHEIVVEKSREIYENLLAEELEDEEVDEATDEEVDESDEDLDEAADEDDDDDEEMSEDFDLDEFEVEADPMDMADPADDMMGDIEMDGEDDMDMDDEGDEELEDRVVDLEDALDELKAEFEKMMDGDDEDDDMDMDMDDDEDEEAEEEAMAFESDDEEVEEAADEEVEESAKTASETMREYVEKVSAGHGAEKKGSGDNGDNTKSAVAGKNDMGGTTANLRGGESKGEGTQGGLANPSTSEENAGNINVPGGKASKSMKAQPKGHGAEKKGSGESGANAKPIIGK
jgi:hypothetical protein